METTHKVHHSSKTTPRDFFLWLGAVIALYGSVSFFITLCFEFVNYAYPDKLAIYLDSYGTTVHVGMAALIVLVPTTVTLFYLIRKSIAEDPGKANIWVRRWAIVLTLFITAVVVLGDLVTLVYNFLDGEVSTRFLFKVAMLFLIAVGVFLHFLAEQKGYWIENPKSSKVMAGAVVLLALITIVSGFLLIGTPNHVRMLRADAQKVNDLYTIQMQIVAYYQQYGKLPADTHQTVDELSDYTLPVDPQTKQDYPYTVTGPLSFEICADFNEVVPASEMKGPFVNHEIAYRGADGKNRWQHGKGKECFNRTIDPIRFPVTKQNVTTAAEKPVTVKK